MALMMLMRSIAAPVMMHPARLMRRCRVRLGVLAGRRDVESAAGAESREQQDHQGAQGGHTQSAHTDLFLSSDHEDQSALATT
jgi:hypothetical protein